MGERKKVVGVFVVHSQSPLEALDGLLGAVVVFANEGRGGRVVFVPGGKVRSLPPVGTGDDVVVAVAVQIGERRAFAPEFVGELDLFEGVKDVVAGAGGAGQKKNCSKKEARRVHGEIEA